METKRERSEVERTKEKTEGDSEVLMTDVEREGDLVMRSLTSKSSATIKNRGVTLM